MIVLFGDPFRRRPEAMLLARDHDLGKILLMEGVEPPELPQQAFLFGVRLQKRFELAKLARNQAAGALIDIQPFLPPCDDVIVNAGLAGLDEFLNRLKSFEGLMGLGYRIERTDQLIGTPIGAEADPTDDQACGRKTQPDCPRM